MRRAPLRFALHPHRSALPRWRPGYAPSMALQWIARRGGRVVDFVFTAIANGISALPRLALALVLAFVTFAMLKEGHWPGTPEIAAWFGVMFWPPAFFVFLSQNSSAEFARRAAGDFMTILLVSSAIEFLGYGHQPPTATW